MSPPSQPIPHTAYASRTIPQALPLATALLALLQHPQQLLRLWNWKAAVLSLVLRGPIFLIASMRRGWETAAAALLTESVFCLLSAGFYGAVVQILRDAQPQWMTGLFLTVVIPALYQVLEYLLHRFRGTPHLGVAEAVSVIASAISALFNWYAMHRGTLLVGAEGRSFGNDVARLPKLIVSFLAVLPKRFFRGAADQTEVRKK